LPLSAWKAALGNRSIDIVRSLYGIGFKINEAGGLETYKSTTDNPLFDKMRAHKGKEDETDNAEVLRWSFGIPAALAMMMEISPDRKPPAFSTDEMGQEEVPDWIEMKLVS